MTRNSDEALLVIDIQNDYFPGGTMELEGADAATAKAAAALARFREQGLPVIHVRHLSVRPGATFFLPGTPGAEIHASVRPKPGETLIEKNFPNSFRSTNLQAQLEGSKVKNARQVHAAFLAALSGFYARVVDFHDL